MRYSEQQQTGESMMITLAEKFLARAEDAAQNLILSKIEELPLGDGFFISNTNKKIPGRMMLRTLIVEGRTFFITQGPQERGDS